MVKPMSLYFLVSSDKSKFKIGIAMDVFQRSKHVSSDPNQINLDESYVIQWPSVRMALNAERSLHFFFDKFRIRDLPRTDGYTEWFNYAAFENALIYVNHLMLNHNMTKDCLHKGISVPEREVNVTVSTRKKPLTKAEKIARTPIYREENSKTIQLVYDKIKTWEPYLLGAEIQENHLHFSYYFGELERNNGNYYVLPEYMLMPINLNSGNIHLNFPSGWLIVNVLTSTSICSNSLVSISVMPYSDLMEDAQHDCCESLSIIADLFASYSPLFHNL